MLIKKRVGRILKTLGLLVKKKSGLGRLKIAPLRPFPIAERVNQVWSIDFLTASLVNGQKFRCFTVVDIFSRQSPTEVYPVLVLMWPTFLVPLFVTWLSDHIRLYDR